MNKTVRVPTTLVGAITYFADPDVALSTFAAFRWPDGVAVCPACESKDTGFLKTRSIWKCRECGKQFSAKVGTVFEDSPIPLTKWLPALWLAVNSKNGISSCELARSLGVTQKTAWFMLHRIRLALQAGKPRRRFKGHVEADETFIGGKAIFMHAAKKKERIRGRGQYASGKLAVMGLLERHGLDGGHSKVRVNIIPNTRKPHTRGFIQQEVEPGTVLYTDALPSYRGLSAEYVHGVIDHAERYAEGQIHTNGLENFWSLLKRAIKGTYVSVEPFHLFRYLDEQVYRFNNRKTKDVARFIDALKGLIGKRLTYQSLIGATT
jgi:transposase-like protein